MTRTLSAVKAVVCALAFAFGVACLAAAGLANAGRDSPWLDLLTHFAPIWLAGSLAAVLCGLLPPGRGMRLALTVIGAAGALAALALIVPELSRPIRPPGPAGGSGRIRLIQFNAWDQNADPGRAADWIVAQHPDVVTVEELTPAFQKALVARGLVFNKGVASTAIFSRDPRGRHPFEVPAGDWKLLPEFARASFPAPDGGEAFSVVAVHLTWPSISRQWGQRDVLASLLDRYPRDRLIVAGDFNLTPWSFTLRRLDGRLGLERRDRAIASWPAMQRLRGRLVMLPAMLPIDHIYAGSAWRTVSLTRGPRLGSEHYPLVIDLALEP